RRPDHVHLPVRPPHDAAGRRDLPVAAPGADHALLLRLQRADRGSAGLGPVQRPDPAAAAHGPADVPDRQPRVPRPGRAALLAPPGGPAGGSGRRRGPPRGAVPAGTTPPARRLTAAATTPANTCSECNFTTRTESQLEVLVARAALARAGIKPAAIPITVAGVL